MKKIKNSAKLSVLLIAITIQLLNLPNAQAKGKKQGVILGGSGGHDVPTPFQVRETRFELADEEIYSLVGTIVILPSVEGSRLRLHPYLFLNLDNHPLLANTKRVDSPLYRIEGQVEKWKKWEDTSINLLCQAHGQIIFTEQGPEYTIRLEPIDAVPFAIQYSDLIPNSENKLLTILQR